jgi:hypothetical protein
MTSPPKDYEDESYQEGRHYAYHLCWTEASGGPRDFYLDCETDHLAVIESHERLGACPGYSGARLGDCHGNEVSL